MTGRHATALCACIALATLPVVGCDNGSYNSTQVAPGGRFALEIETGRSDVVGTHFLVDTITGDLWRLDTRGAGTPIWVRIADGPADAEALDDVVAPTPAHGRDDDTDD